MMDDSDLRRLFREAREADEASAPAFEKIRRAVPRHATDRQWRWGLVALPAAAALALAVTLLFRQAGPEKPGEAVRTEANVPTLDEWTAPTDFLLETPGSELLGSTPHIGEAIPDLSVSEPPTRSKGR